MKKFDKKQVIIGTLASLVMLVFGYILWKHEHAADATLAAQSEAANQDAANQVEQELAALQASAPSYAEEPAYYPSSDTASSGSASDPLATAIEDFFTAAGQNGTSTGATTGATTGAGSSSNGAASSGASSGSTSTATGNSGAGSSGAQPSPVIAPIVQKPTNVPTYGGPVGAIRVPYKPLPSSE